MREQVLKEIEVLPFKHDANDFWQAVGITSKDLSEALSDIKKFNSFNLSKRLRILSITALITLKALLRNLDNEGSILALLIALVCESSGKRDSERVEIIEENLIEYLKRAKVSLKQFEESLNRLFDSISKTCVSQCMFYRDFKKTFN